MKTFMWEKAEAAPVLPEDRTRAAHLGSVLVSAGKGRVTLH